MITIDLSTISQLPNPLFQAVWVEMAERGEARICDGTHTAQISTVLENINPIAQDLFQAIQGRKQQVMRR